MASEGWDFRFEIEWEGCVASEGWDFRFEIEGEVRSFKSVKSHILHYSQEQARCLFHKE